MLRVTTQNDAEATRLKIEGRLAGTEVHEVESHWHALKSVRPHFPVLIDLTGVTFVDQAGKELLAEMHRHGDNFVAPGLMMSAIVEEISRRA